MAESNYIKGKRTKTVLGRLLRNAREAVKYPFWIANGSPPPDNHYFKVRRIKAIGRRYNCITVIETGTFFGQTVAAVRRQFNRVLSVELSDVLYEGNREVFKKNNNIKLFHGNSSDLLPEMIDQATGRIIFWLDGHFSAGITACGKEMTPILDELRVIKQKMRTSDCILIDDVRLFLGEKGYPTLNAVKEIIYSICPDYNITIDHDCFVALPADPAVDSVKSAENIISSSRQ